MLQWRSAGKKNRQAGFALIDALLGMTILTVALLGIAFAFRQSTVTTVSARNYNQATYYAQQALERLKVYDGKETGTWAGTVNVPASGVMPAFQLVTEQIDAANMPADYTSLPETIKGKMVPVRATVTWQETAGGALMTRTVQVSSYYYLK